MLSLIITITTHDSCFFSEFPTVVPVFMCSQAP